MTPASIALAWMLSKPYVTAPVVGANRPEHLDDAVAALDVRLSPEQIARLEAPYRPKRAGGVSRADVDAALAYHRGLFPDAQKGAA